MRFRILARLTFLVTSLAVPLQGSASPCDIMLTVTPHVETLRRGILGDRTTALSDQSLLNLKYLMMGGEGTGGQLRLLLRSLPGSLTLYDDGALAEVFVQNGPQAQHARHVLEDYAKEQGLKFWFHDIRRREVTPPEDLEVSRQFFISLDSAEQVDSLIQFLTDIAQQASRK